MSTALQRAQHRLHIVNLNLTGRCNLDCACCYQKRRKDDMSTAQILRIIDDVAALGTRILMLPGGEPLLRKDLDLVVERAASHGLQTYLASNATLITDERARELKRRGLTGCCVGVEVFDPRAVREVDRAGLARTIEGLRCFARAGLDTFANVIVTRRNLEHLHATVRLLVGLGIRKVTVLRPKPASAGPWFEESRLGPEEMYRLQLAKVRIEASLDVEFVNLDCALGALHGGLPLELLEEEGIDACMAGRRYVSIDSNGDVYPCAYLKFPEFFAGNAARTSLVEIVATSPVFHSFRDRRLEGHCGSCPMNGSCGGCRALAYHDHGSVRAQDEDCHWGRAGTGRKVWMGTRFWALMIQRFVRMALGLRSGGSEARSERVIDACATLPRRRRGGKMSAVAGGARSACGGALAHPTGASEPPSGHPSLEVLAS